MFGNSWLRMMTGVLAVVALAASMAPAQSVRHHRAKKAAPAGESADQTQPTAAVVDPHFSFNDREIIRVYYKTLYWKQGGGVWPIRANFGGSPAQARLPVERNVALPRDMRQKFKAFPADLESRLEPLPPHFARGSIDYDILIVNVLSYRVAEVVHDFLRSGVEGHQPGSAN